MKLNKKMKVLKVHEKESLLGGFESKLNLNHRAATCDCGGACCCDNYASPVSPSSPASSVPASPLPTSPVSDAPRG